MPQITLPLIKGLSKNFRDADYIDALPVNMLSTPKEVVGAAGYLRSFPGIDKKADVDGVSRGVQYNTHENAAYRVCGGKIYRGETEIADVSGSDRVSMAHSAVSQAVAHAGVMTLYRYDGEIKQLENWPESETVVEPSTSDVKSWVSDSGDAEDNFFSVTETNAEGYFLINVTPKLTTGVTGELLQITESEWNLSQSQEVSLTAPYITDLIVLGAPVAGNTVYIKYTLNIPSGLTGTNATEFDVTQNVDEVTIDYNQYEIGSVRDICRIRGRYIWVKDGTQTFGVTDLTDESHPDQYAPFYSAESQPDGIIACGAWRDFAVMFGSSTIEYFSLTGATTVGAALYVAQPSLMVQKGIAGTHCKTVFGDSFAFISNPSTGAPSVYVISSGQAQSISTATVEKVLREYTSEELSAGVMETLRFDAHELLIIHLPSHVLCFDAAASASGAQWAILKTGYYDDVHQAIDYVYEGNIISCGDKYQGRTGKLNFKSSAQYDAQQEHLLYTPMIKADNARVFDFMLEASTGVAQIADKLFLSATEDGIMFGREQPIVQNSPFDYNRRILWRRIGRIRRNIGFKVRVITKSPVTLSDCRVRVE